MFRGLLNSRQAFRPKCYPGKTKKHSPAEKSAGQAPPSRFRQSHIQPCS
ncbi:hypothetical protein HMPREF3038_00057 [Akkermansia sp. KLE1797]|nr:hypothetical protein HMPREF3038_00057 [Akkermansia sp. KLE1797]KXU55712.1 hypothetical protein HMPREF3039_00065 [Akkermansia sp. KLE1798]KZA05265.1 hypothetical protein HMPREF1326_01025 [Akkermansia sp. KLE1605]